MHEVEPGLFDLPAPKPKPPSKRSQCGRNRETWVLTATAGVAIIDAAAVTEAAARAEADGLMVGFSAEPIAANSSHPPAGAVAQPADGAVDLLAWLIWPTDGLDALLEAGAFRIVSVDSQVVAESTDRCTATWTVMIKLTDVDRLRRLATQAHPDEAGLIANSLAAAWQSAADPFAPLHSIPGIVWQPVKVDVAHLPARPAAETR